MALRPDDGLLTGSDGLRRCWWHGGLPDYLRYHDDEWGHPVVEDQRLFEKLCLEGFQAGLSWLTILRKRENFRMAFDGFDFERVAGYTERDVARLLADAGIVRHRQKIESTINNAKRAIELRDEYGSLAGYFWGFEPDTGQRPPSARHRHPDCHAVHRDIQAPVQGFEAARLDLRRADDGVCLHAGDGPGERSRGRMLRPGPGRGQTRRARSARPPKLTPPGG